MRESFISAADTRNLFRDTERGAGRSSVPYLALHPMGFSVPPRLLSGRWALTPPFHPYPTCVGRFLLCGTVRRDVLKRPSRTYPRPVTELCGIAPCGVRTFLPRPRSGAILHPSRAKATIRHGRRKTRGGWFRRRNNHGKGTRPPQDRSPARPARPCTWRFATA